MKKSMCVLFIFAMSISGCATGINYWNQLSPETQVALIQAGQRSAQEALTTYLDYCHANKVAADATKVARLKAELDAANAALKTASDALIKDKSK